MRASGAVLGKVAYITFESVRESLECDNSNESF